MKRFAVAVLLFLVVSCGKNNQWEQRLSGQLWRSFGEINNNQDTIIYTEFLDCDESVMPELEIRRRKKKLYLEFNYVGISGEISLTNQMVKYSKVSSHAEPHPMPPCPFPLHRFLGEFYDALSSGARITLVNQVLGLELLDNRVLLFRSVPISDNPAARGSQGPPEYPPLPEGKSQGCS